MVGGDREGESERWWGTPVRGGTGKALNGKRQTEQQKEPLDEASPRHTGMHCKKIIGFTHCGSTSVFCFLSFTSCSASLHTFYHAPPYKKFYKVSPHVSFLTAPLFPRFFSLFILISTSIMLYFSFAVFLVVFLSIASYLIFCPSQFMRKLFFLSPKSNPLLTDHFNALLLSSLYPLLSAHRWFILSWLIFISASWRC